ncbi:MAG: hypothetical protein KAR06_05430 [Deltaproteobacteria bacterium]|nr:hypothetical protein [Deltaproteobacteria bacterium]
MIGRNCYNYILIGLNLRILRHATSTRLKEGIEGNVSQLLSALERCGFDVSLAFTKNKNFCKMQDDISALKKNSSLGKEIVRNVNEEFEALENIVFAESETKKVYVIPSRRFNTEFLLNNPEKLLKDGLFDKLSEVAQHDLSSSCRCLLFGEATASAFHILRATEAVLKSYYYKHKKQKRLKEPMWGSMVQQLRAKKTNCLPETTLNSLDSIREGYRNPTQHPEAVYDIDKAQDLFGVCLDAIGKMAETL